MYTKLSKKKRVCISLFTSIIFLALGFLFKIYDATSIKNLIRIPLDFTLCFIFIYLGFTEINVIKEGKKEN
jgi:hypothetical protein